MLCISELAWLLIEVLKTVGALLCNLQATTTHYGRSVGHILFHVNFHSCFLSFVSHVHSHCNVSHCRYSMPAWIWPPMRCSTTNAILTCEINAVDIRIHSLGDPFWICWSFLFAALIIVIIMTSWKKNPYEGTVFEVTFTECSQRGKLIHHLLETAQCILVLFPGFVECQFTAEWWLYMIQDFYD